MLKNFNFRLCKCLAAIGNLFRLRKLPPVVVSLTSYPPRIDNLLPMLETLFVQTRKADKIVLWLAETEFPRREGDLPQYLMELAQQEKITIEWCYDLKPHKKYFYALQKYRNSIVITVDDDLLYAPDMIECLLASYVKFPYAVSAMRTHLMKYEGNKFAEYQQFLQQQNLLIGEPSMRLLATNGAGSLFPPKLLKRKYFKEKTIENLCLYTDDLWLKTIEVLSAVPVVQVQEFTRLKYVENSQDIALKYENTLRGGNDRDLENIRRWADGLCGQGYFLRRIFEVNYACSQYKKLCGRNTVLYFVPHQDDELLSMGLDICMAVAKGNDVHVILCTDGAKSKIRKVLSNNKECSLHRGKHSYDLDEEKFSRARDAEFAESCVALGVLPANIHILPLRATDGMLDTGFAETVIMRYLAMFGARATVGAIYCGNDETQHKDHKALGTAVQNLWQRKIIKKVRFFAEPYGQIDKNLGFIAKSAPKKFRAKLLKAIQAYCLWQPEKGRYAVGAHSVMTQFADFRKNMTMYYMKKSCDK